MMETRLSLALEAGHVSLPPSGDIAVLGAVGQPLSGLPIERLVMVCDDVIAARGYEAQGCRMAEEIPVGVAGAVVFVPRGRLEGRVLFARAAQAVGGEFIVDGMKTDGVDSHWKELRKRGTCSAAYSKAHGKVFSCTLPSGAGDDWLEAGKGAVNKDGFFTVPGIFSSEKADEGSKLLAAALPAKLGKEVADFGAGWGFLAREVLTREGVEALHLIEADRRAMACAARNVEDSRAAFVWDDATRWEPKVSLDAIVMNPPFHAGRKGVPELGQAFIANAARALKGAGRLYLVANRHLPYEETLRTHFGRVDELDGGNTRFKIIVAAKPSRKR